MSATNRQATLQHERPWTPGPWERHGWIVRSGQRAVAASGRNDDQWDDDAKLIALAPDMAEALIGLVECYEPETEDDRDDMDALEVVHAVADKLRAIGATDA